MALTKVGLVDEDVRLLAELEVAEHMAGTFLEGAEVVPVGCALRYRRRRQVRPAGCPRAAAGGDAHGSRPGRPRLWVDRSFAIKGSGTVVTGSSPAARFRRATPGNGASGTEVRVRGLESHGRSLDRATPGRRLAVNVLGLSHHDVSRGGPRAPQQWHRHEGPRRLVDRARIAGARAHPSWGVP